jgi:putative transposase
MSSLSRAKPESPFRYFKLSPEVIRLVVLIYVRYPLSLRHVEDLLSERGYDVSHETVRFWSNRFGPLFAADVCRQRVSRMRGFRHWKWHLDEVYVKINGEMRYLWRAVDHKGEVLESYVTKTRGQESGARFHLQGVEASRLARGDRHRRTTLLRRRHGRAGQPGQTGDWPPRE